jgi:hypothetical protein
MFQFHSAWCVYFSVHGNAVARITSRFASYTTRVGSIVTPHLSRESTTEPSSRSLLAYVHTRPASRKRSFSLPYS